MRILRNILIFVVIVLTTSFFTGDNNDVKLDWNVYIVQTGVKEADIYFTTNIPKNWQIYSQTLTNIDGPLPTEIYFDPDSTFVLVGKPVEVGNVVKFYQSQLGINVICLQNKVKYIQHIQIKTQNTFTIKCVINYMLSKGDTIQAPDDEDFVLTIFQ